ncbi:hypothetical protein [Actinoplanes sp. NPDC049265]|uniref:hypothetical protein n=1 Tax=Actinoplanes sp. NPDC049265 TaxID=3363902 RepID=UPI0037224A35
MLFALGRPAVFAGLLIGFVLAVLLRAFAIRLAGRSLNLSDRLSPRLRDNVDPFGAVAAAVGGAGWGKALDVDEVPRTRGRGRAALVFLAGPIVTIVAGQLVFLAYRLLFPFPVANLSALLRGLFPADAADGFLLGVAGSLLGFGLLSLLPIPPLDGFGLLWSAHRRPGPGLQGYRLWFQEKNIGVVVLLACCFYPLGNPLLLLPVDLLGTVFLALWG